MIADRLILHLPRRLSRIRANVQRAEPHYAESYRRVRPLIVVGAVSAWLGMWWEIVSTALRRRARR
jgi:hypothetical protein